MFTTMMRGFSAVPMLCRSARITRRGKFTTPLSTTPATLAYHFRSAVRKMSNQIYLDLPSGARMPVLGLGTWQANEEAVGHAVETALDAGYRLIDTALGYGNEKAIANVLHDRLTSGRLQRQDIFITTKLPGVYLGSRERVRKGFERSYKNLGLDYIDLYMIHSPFGKILNEEESFDPVDKDGKPAYEHLDLVETWKAMEELVDEGRVRSLGLSNCNSKQVQRIVDIARHPVCNLQVECNVYFTQSKLHEFCKARNITLTAFAPLGSPGRPARVQAQGQGNPLEDKVICDIAEKYIKTPAQVLLRNLIEKGIAVIPKSTNPSRVQENIQVFDFHLTDKEMETIAKLDRNVRVFNFKHSHGIVDHPEYPFHIPF